MCGWTDQHGNRLPYNCDYCGCPKSGAPHTPQQDQNGRTYCGICHQWL